MLVVTQQFLSLQFYFTIKLVLNLIILKLLALFSADWISQTHLVGTDGEMCL